MWTILLGFLPGKIGSKLIITCGSNLFYNMSRPTIQESNNEDLDSLIEMHKNGYEKRIKASKSRNLAIINNEILESFYSDDIVIMDDTAMTNMYGLPLEAMIVVDQEAHTQLFQINLQIHLLSSIKISWNLEEKIQNYYCRPITS